MQYVFSLSKADMRFADTSGGGHDPDTSVECMRMHVQGTAPPAWQLGEARPHQCCASDGPRRATSLQQHRHVCLYLLFWRAP